VVSEISWLVFGNHIMESFGEKWQKSVIILYDSIGQASSFVLRQMGVIDIKSGKLVRSQTVDLCNIVFIRGDGTRRRCSRQYRVFDETEVS